MHLYSQPNVPLNTFLQHQVEARIYNEPIMHIPVIALVILVFSFIFSAFIWVFSKVYSYFFPI